MKVVQLNIVVLIVVQTYTCFAEKCAETALHYEFSECDNSGSRWMFRVPKSNSTCELTDSSLPRRIECSNKMCASGMYLNASTHDCQLCPQGYYSRGDRYEVTNWDQIPSELLTDVTYNKDNKDLHCDNSGWFPQRIHLLGTTSPGCSIMLSMKVNILNPANITFSYRLLDYSSMAFFTIRNDRCSLVPGSSVLLPRTSPYSYVTRNFIVPPGQHVLQWYLFAEDGVIQRIFGTKTSEIFLKDLILTGAFTTSACSVCPEGTFSDKEGADQCTKCPLNTFSLTGATNCIPCQITEYAIPGSNHCTRRLPCKKEDYLSYWTPCDANGKSQRKWKWIEPRICDDHSGVSLPETESPVDCRPCPTGTILTGTNGCTSCPVGRITDQKNFNRCKSCASNEVPVYGLKYFTWSRLPPLINLFCSNYFGHTCHACDLGMDSLRCGVGTKWDEVIKIELPLPFGFVSYASSRNIHSIIPQPPIPDTYLRVEFEVVCSVVCFLSLKEVKPNGDEYLITEVYGPKSRQNFTHTIHDSSPTTFVFTFEKRTHGSTEDPKHLHDHLRIYQLEVMNTHNTSAVACSECANGIKDGKCKQCPIGLYYTRVFDPIKNVSLVNCTVCPHNTITIADAYVARSVNEACAACEPGLIAVNNSVCVIDAFPITRNGIQYNLTELLQKPVILKGPKMFTPSGAPYAHEFQIILTYDQRVHCVENMTGTHHHVISSMICRQTNLNPQSTGSPVQYTRPLRLGDHLVKAIPSNENLNFWNEINRNLTRAGWTKDETGNDLHYIFHSNERTSICPKGITTTVTLRCALQYEFMNLRTVHLIPEKYFRGNVELPPSCPDGTCDGCNYHFLWISFSACPICKMDQYFRIEEKCIFGHRKIHFLSPPECRAPANKNLTIVESCPILSSAQLVAVLLTFFVLVVLAVIIFICYRRNKKLEYKYMKLIQSTTGKTQVTSCAIEDNDVDNIDAFGRRTVPNPTVSSDTVQIDPSWHMNFKGFPKLNIPPVIFTSKNDEDREVLADENQIS